MPSEAVRREIADLVNDGELLAELEKIEQAKQCFLKAADLYAKFNDVTNATYYKLRADKLRVLPTPE